MEYLGNGTLDNFLNRVLRTGLPMPNRFLFRIFRCLLRACIAMAWPPKQPRGAPLRTEEIPDNLFLRNSKAQIVHNDMHSGNILIGDLDSEEHTLIPAFKIIDFGNYDEEHANEPGNLGVRENLRDVGMTMYTIIQSGVYPIVRTIGQVTLNLPGGTRTFETESTDLGDPDIYPHLDPDLASLVMWCLARNVDDAPQLEDLFQAVQLCCRDKTSDRYSNCEYGHLETRQGMKEIVQMLMLDADVTMD
ncbi:hypothetical protein F5X99DRAFT_395133 [Biscogniauxia marginata]|nr:hypothetical protein F5X99DRAFT_395133 [Biscogniauxia marginata]